MVFINDEDESTVNCSNRFRKAENVRKVLIAEILGMFSFTYVWGYHIDPMCFIPFCGVSKEG